jgi:hypothetical protein
MKTNNSSTRSFAIASLWLYQSGLDMAKSSGELNALARSLALVFDRIKKEITEELRPSPTVKIAEDWNDEPTRPYLQLVPR